MAHLFRTEAPRLSYPFDLDHSQPILCYGSCFAEHMAKQLAERKFETLLNPFGITYHPLQIAKGLAALLKPDQIREEQVFAHRGLWQSFDFHSQFSNPEKAIAIARMNQSLERGAAFLQQAELLIVTLGTAYGFVDLATGEVVNNCHKLPAKQFEKRLFRPEMMLEPLEKLFAQLRAQQPGLQIILTVSPVRHLKDGMVENQRSKAALLLLAADLEAQLEYVHYFPAYELVMDDLRDYRFYEEDLLHPNSVAVGYIWSYFKEAFFSEKNQQLLTQIEKIATAKQHRPFHPRTEGHQAFIRQQLTKIQDIQRLHPRLDFSEEVRHFSKNLR